MNTPSPTPAAAQSGSTNPLPEEEPPRTERWWEQYTVRYFVGTVVGVGILLVLRDWAVMHEDIGLIIPERKDITGGEAAIVGALGLAYCYISSVPVLTLHALRGSLHLKTKHRMWVFWLIFVSVVVAVLFSDCFNAAIRNWHGIGKTLLATTVLAQGALIFAAQKGNFAEIFKFYENLAAARRKPDKHGLVESYRHLREHGNAVMIVLLEIVFGIIIASASTPTELVVSLIAWLLPAAATWLIASVLEAKFAG